MAAGPVSRIPRVALQPRKLLTPTAGTVNDVEVGSDGRFPVTPVSNSPRRRQTARHTMLSPHSTSWPKKLVRPSTSRKVWFVPEIVAKFGSVSPDFEPQNALQLGNTPPIRDASVARKWPVWEDANFLQCEGNGFDPTSDPTMDIRRSPLRPGVLDLRRTLQGLHHHAILFRFRLQRTQLLLRCLRCADVENDSDALKSDRGFFRYSQGSLQVKIALDRDINALGRDSHRRGHHLASDLSAGGERTQQQVSGAGSRAGSTNTWVCLRIIDCPSQVDRAGDGRVGLTPVRGQRDQGTRRVLPVPVFQRALQRSNIHESSPAIWGIISALRALLRRWSWRRVKIRSKSRSREQRSEERRVGEE